MGRTSKPQETATQRVATELRVWRARRDWTVTELAERAGLPKSTTAKILRGTMSIDVEHLAKIAAALGVEPRVIVAAALDDDANPDPNVTGAAASGEAEYQVERAEESVVRNRTK